MTKGPSALTVPSRSGTARNSKAPFGKAPASPVLARNPSLRGSIWAGLAAKGKTMLLMDMLYGVQLTYTHICVCMYLYIDIYIYIYTVTALYQL